MKRNILRTAALLLVTALLLSSLSGCITTAILAGVAATNKVKEEFSSKETEAPEEETTAVAEDPEETDPESGEEETEEPKETQSAAEETETAAYDPEINENFLAFTERVFGELMSSDTLSTHYHVYDPEKYGIDTSEITFDELSASEEDLKEYEETILGYKKELEAFDYESLDWEGRLTYDAFMRYLEVEEEGFGLDLLYEPLGPNSGIQAMLPVELEQYVFYRESDIPVYIELLNQTPAYFESIMKFEQDKADAGLFMEDDILENTISQIEEFVNAKEDSFLITTFPERLEELSLSDSDREKYIEENEKAVLESVYPAYEYLLQELPKLKGRNEHQGGLCNYPGGEEFYAYLLKATVGSDKTPDEMIDMLDQAIDESMNTINYLLRNNPSLYSVFENSPYTTQDPNLCLRILQSKIEKDWPEIPEVDYAVKYVDASLREYLSPACYMVPPVDGDVRNSILINCDRGAEEEDIFITLAHEGYPGHLYQMNYFKDNATYMLRDAIGTGGFAEGYATYVENSAYDYVDGLSKDGAEILRANARISLYIYARVDLGIHWEGWDVDDVERYISDYFDGAEEAAQWMYDYMRADPGSYEMYAVGELEILDIENEARDADDFDLKEFHTKLLDCAEAPFEVIRQNILE